MPMPRPENKYDRRHLQFIQELLRQIDEIYKSATREAAAIGVSIGSFDSERPLDFKDYPLTARRVDRLVKQLGKALEVCMVNGVESEWTLANNKNNELAKRVFGKNVGRLTQAQYRRYFSNNDAAREAFVKRKENGLTLSDRVWKYTDEFKDEIEMGIDLGLRGGLSADQMARDLQQYLQHPDMLFRRVRDEHGILHLSKRAKDYHPGQGVYRSSYKNARRLAATECNTAYRTADHERWQQMDFVVGQEVHLSGNHTCKGKDGKPHKFEDMCDKLAGKYPKDFKFTGWHPHCRCYATSILKTDDEIAEDTQKMLAGEAVDGESVNRVDDVPEGFKAWVQENEGRMEKTKTLPGFLRENSGYVGVGTINLGGTYNTASTTTKAGRKPPRMDTYTQVSENVLVSDYCQESEIQENTRLATFLAEKTKEDVFVLPHIQPTEKDAERKRKELFPKGVKENKNPDLYFRKRFVDGKVMTEAPSSDAKLAKRNIQNRLQDAFEQADDALLEIPVLYPKDWINAAIKGKLKSSKHYHVVYVKYGEELIIYDNQK